MPYTLDPSGHAAVSGSTWANNPAARRARMAAALKQRNQARWNTRHPTALPFPRGGSGSDAINVPGMTGAPGPMTGDLSSLLPNYTAPLPDLANTYMKTLNQGMVNLPTFDQLFKTYKTTAERATNEQVAQLGEAFGSSGGRYGSNILAGASRLRENLGNDLASKAAQYQAQLRGQQASEIQFGANLGASTNENAMQRLFADFLRRTSPPPLLSSAQSYANNFGQPTQVFA